MDWDLKMPHPWDMDELGPNAAAEPSNIIHPTSAALDCSVDLKLGGLGDFGPATANKWKEHRVPTTSTSVASSSGTPKRARGPGGGGGSQNAACSVDGCRADLSGCREYHKRHKVCEVHSKTPVVLIGGQEQRFCQQCSRFHSLVEFDEVKRSCRKRLDGHNRRRRKPQPDSINPGGLFTNHQGNRFSSYPHIFPTAASDSGWPVIMKTEEESLYSHHPPVHFLDRQNHHYSSSFPRTLKESKHFPFLQDSDRVTLEPSICQPLLNTISSAESSSNNNKIFSNGLPQVLDSECALSLLSSPPQTSSINLSQIVPSAERIPMGQPFLSYGGGLGLGRYSGSHQASSHVSTTGFSCSAMEDENVGTTVLVSDASDPEMNCQGMFDVGGEGSSDGGSQALPFSWH